SDPAPLDWTAEGAPRSPQFGDIYFSPDDGLAESRAVFLAGCGLPKRWQGRRRFTVGELGFGTGLNIVALIDLWRRTRPAGAVLNIFSLEAHPLARADAARALARWPETAEVAQALIDRWPSAAPGFHRVDLPEWGVILDLAVMEAGEALAAWSGAADAWFLDGFAPAANPQMWRDELLQLVAARSRPGAVAATFTVAGQVRRGLAAAGFAVEKQPGFGRKRERLEARLPGAAPEPAGPRVAIVGAGIAGAAAARALRGLGVEPLLLDAAAPGAGASGNPAALVTPRLDAGLGPLAQLSAQALRRAVALYEDVPGAVLSRGVLQLAHAARDAGRFAKIAASGLFDDHELASIDAAQASARLGEPAPAALDMALARVIGPAAPLAAWASGTLAGRVARIAPEASGWRLLDAAGATLAQAEAVVLAAGLDSHRLWPGLPLSAVRGQASWADGVGLAQACAWGGYAAPMPGGVLFGATHDREDAEADLRPADHARNLQLVAAALPSLAERLAAAPIHGRASVRAVTPDRLPMAGHAPGAPPGLFVLTGFGSRGFAFAPLLAEHVAAQIAGAPSPLPRALAAIVDPARFEARRIRKRPGIAPGPPQP
ncbi:MAG: FAD-dependent 5-carboxymethylaminomethyl-2-thiouridine(34) oxidoreductase MnmC, partial [Phenylobacterium sp.]